jgi:translation elongation factor EF-Tu-like GTPase
MTVAEPFRLQVEDVFNISGRGTALLGLILEGEVSVGELLAVEGREAGPLATCEGINAAPRVSKTLDDGLPRVGLMVPAWSKDDIAEGDVLVTVERA